MIFTSPAPSGGPFRDDEDIYELIFEDFPAKRPDVRGTGIPMLIDDSTSHSLTFEQIRMRVDNLSLALYDDLGMRKDSVIGIFSANNIDYPVVIWATHRLGGIVSAANPAFQPGELNYQLEASKATVLFVNENQLDAGLAAAAKAGIHRDKVIVIESVESIRKARAKNGDKAPMANSQGIKTVEGLVEHGTNLRKARGEAFLKETRFRLNSGEGQRKLAFISFSSGTTGLPKGVAIQHYAPVSNVLQAFAYNECTNEVRTQKGRFRAGTDRSLGILPAFHIYGLVMGIHFMFYAGVTNVVIPRFKGIDTMLNSIVKHNISIWFLVPPQVVLLCKDPSVPKYHADMQRLANYIMIGAAPLSDDLSKQLMHIIPGVDWSQGYGMSETSTLLTQGPPGHPAVLGSAGRLVSDVEAKVVTPEGKECGVDEQGELWVRAPSITLGYLNNRKATEEMFLPDGFMKTGDEVVFNKHGDMFIVDRLKELIKVRGFQVAPAELEGFLLDHADVNDSGVIGVPDESAGELPLAFITLSINAKGRVQKEGKAAEEKIRQSIMKFVKDHKIKYKHLCDVQFIDQIPKTASGKILRRQLRDKARALPARSTSSKL
ncbi:acetyl-CoA synthetase-like protein [Tilletiaria anomala UBC 951]|uniref:Acetyl-CoA synthetase-like protein n=1 Tax=Tilletiaria anomala (strain ATCC 24038 / CBS 436.72 / UBC 951) TaxID=1037660 RepID=A0A066VIN8_TILAU|nr:acetyl-CoA synthetase-like protein [Tilletiaria anomala UBC 951]KDN41612.1 acetyl-CoA synthetase-like protein [Tilletiaria anomala UBC 951]